MTTNEFLSLVKSRGATIFPPASETAITFANTELQNIRAAMLPAFMFDLYKHCSGITLGSACIFGTSEIQRGIKYPLPSIEKINHDMIGNKNLFGKTVFGINDLFWFAFDANGTCFMLDNLTLSVLRKYDDPYRAMVDCLIIGKV
jgi:hypothetical protein